MDDRVFTIDLAKCTGCQTCRIACHDRAATHDGIDLLRIETEESGVFPSPTLTYRVVHCYHCVEPPCADVCPVEAIAKDTDGWVLIDQETCIGCGACVEACPFCAITLADNSIAIKCDGCHEEVDWGWEPTCVRACPMRALHFGTLPADIIENRMEDPCFDSHDIEPRVTYLHWSRAREKEDM